MNSLKWPLIASFIILTLFKGTVAFCGKAGAGDKNKKIDCPTDLDCSELETIKLCGLLSTFVYNLKRSNMSVWNDLLKNKFDSWHLGYADLPNGSVRAFIVADDEENNLQYVVVSGSDGYKDWIDNAQYVGGKSIGETRIFMHTKFAKSANDLYKLHIRGHLIPGRNVVVTGHSLGGAVAVIIGMLIQEEDKCHLKRAYTFGQPKFTTTFRNNEVKSGLVVKSKFPLLRIVNKQDPVPKLPPFSLLKRHTNKTGQYDHIGDVLEFYRDRVDFKKFVKSDGTFESDTSSLKNSYESFNSNPKAHSMYLYNQNLGRLRP